MISPTIKSAAIASVVGIAVLGFVAWRVNARPPVRFTHTVVIFDNSGSMFDEKAGLIGTVERALMRPGLAIGSVLTVMGVGDSQTGNEPRLIARYDVPYSRRALEGKSAIAKRKGQILADLQERATSISRTDRSPIFLAVKRAIELLRGSGCVRDSDCYLFVRTDAEETSELSITKAIDGSGKLKGLPKAMENEGVKVILCGLSETGGAASTERMGRGPSRNARRGDRVREVWASLFTASDLVTFEPYCPRLDGERIVAK